MTQPLDLGNCCGSSIAGIRKITFPDGDQAGLIGLDAVMQALYREGKTAEDSTISEMIARLREKNYIPDSPSALELYQKALLSEYRRFVEKKNR